MKFIIAAVLIVSVINVTAQTEITCNCKKANNKNSIVLDGTIKMTENILLSKGVKQTYKANITILNEGNCAAQVMSIQFGNGIILINKEINNIDNNTMVIDKEFKITKKLAISNDGEDNWTNAIIKFKVKNKVCEQKQKIKIALN